MAKNPQQRGRKRKSQGEQDCQPQKHRKLVESSAPDSPLLNKLYARLVTLPNFLLQHPVFRTDKRRRQLEALLSRDVGLENYLVGSNVEPKKCDSTLRVNRLVSFTQARRQDEEHDLTMKSCSLEEVGLAC